LQVKAWCQIGERVQVQAAIDRSGTLSETRTGFVVDPQACLPRLPIVTNKPWERYKNIGKHTDR